MVAFDTRLKNFVTNAKVGSKIVFNDVQLNIGTGYDASTGIFTAPYSGVYVFEWTLMTETSKEVLTELMVNGKPRSYSHCRSVAGPTSDTCSKMAVVELKAKQHVWIQVFIRPAYV
ncbi:complement C1q tumor necrosis factor-related protein 3-like [Saccostrea cucullata]|uniref:complement C1q tumor necrosis factor-related protein 3-like n=1 Tax=Saccostrea cuccullata TaxID=36930 RepID=UPI002ED12D9B